MSDKNKISIEKKLKTIEKDKKVKFREAKKKPVSIIDQAASQITVFKQQNQTLQEDLQQDYKNNDYEKLSLLQDECTSYAKKIEMESKRQRDLEHLILIAEQQLQDHRKKMSKSDGVQLPTLIKKQRTLESQLEQIKLKHNESLAQINSLMEQINTARRERVIYSNVFKKLETDIRAKEEEFKKQLFIRKQIEQELSDCEAAYQKMKNQATQATEVNKQEYNSLIKTNRLDDSEDIAIADQTILPKQETMKQTQTKETLQPKGQTQHQQMMKDVEDASTFEFMFEKLKKETGINSVEEIIHVYRTIEETNNELYRKVNNLNDEIDKEEREILEVQKKIKQFNNKNQKEDMEADEEKFKYGQQLERSEKLDRELKEAETEIKDIESELAELAQKLQIKIDPTSEITLMQLIEQRAYELIDLCNYFDSQQVNIDNRRNEQDSIVSQKEDQLMTDLLEGMENEKEAERILSRNDFKDISSKEINQYQKKSMLKKKKE